MTDAFTPAADFSALATNEAVQIDKVLHQAFVKVDEDGTEAAAATAVIGKATTAPIALTNWRLDAPLRPGAPMLGQLISLYSFVVLVAVVLSWIPAARGTQFARMIEAITEPVFERVRRVVPPMGGFDMSPMIVMIGLQVLRRVLL